MVQTVVALALARNNKAMKKNPSGLPAFQPGGRRRLVRYAAYYGRLLKLCGLGRWWDQFIEYLSKLAIGIRDGVFLGRGSETACDLVLCMLGDNGFRTRTSAATQSLPQLLLDAIQDGDLPEVIKLVRASYDDPV